MKDLKTIILSVSVSVIASAVILSVGLSNIARADKTVSVRGLAEREVDADLAVWPLTFSLGSNDLTELQKDILAKTEIVKSYLTLQRTRFEDIFTDEYEIEEGLSSIRVPRLILQPLVENSIYHGIRPKGEHGVIRVTAKRQEDFLFLSIYDNGIGMSAHQRELLFSGKDSRSFGFQGTIERIRYYYKTEDVFEIHSTEGEYCEIILKLPLSNGC